MSVMESLLEVGNFIWVLSDAYEKLTENKKQFLDLLLLADEQENMIILVSKRTEYKTRR